MKYFQIKQDRDFKEKCVTSYMLKASSKLFVVFVPFALFSGEKKSGGGGKEDDESGVGGSGWG